jgi:ubiquinone/menaquinone biosynthesis C-methylase UbiE
VDSGESLRRFGQVFDQAAEAYDEVRPSYPDSLIDVAMERGNLGPGSRVVEVGSGTGKLTESLVRRQLTVDAVEPGSNMVAAARRRLGPTDAVTFHLGRFEDVELPVSAFDAVFSASAFHWVDPEVGWAKAASLLRADGLLALLIHRTLRNEQTAEVQDELLEVLHKHAPEQAATWPRYRHLDFLLEGASQRRTNASEVWDWLVMEGHFRMAEPAAADLFVDVEVAADVHTVEQTADELIALFRTSSLYHRIDPARWDALEQDDRAVLDRFGGTIRWSVAAVLMTARRASGI